MLSTTTVLTSALQAADLATRVYVNAVATLSPTARRWDAIAAELTLAADLLAEQSVRFAPRVAQLRARAVDAAARAQRQRALTAQRERLAPDMSEVWTMGEWAARMSEVQP